MNADNREINAMWRLGQMGSIKEACERIIQLNNWNEQTIIGLENQVKDLKDIHYKDNEIKSMKEKVQQMEHDLYQGFSITDDEWNDIKRWKNQHEQSFHNNKPVLGTTGGNWFYEFIPTSIGTIKHCNCSICYKKAQHLAFENGENWSKEDVASKYINMCDAQFDFSEL